MPMHDEFDGFSINLIFEDEEWVAHFSELPNISALGDTPEEAIEELKIAWSAYKESCRKHNEEVPISPVKKNIAANSM